MNKLLLLTSALLLLLAHPAFARAPRVGDVVPVQPSEKLERALNGKFNFPLAPVVPWKADEKGFAKHPRILFAAKDLPRLALHAEELPWERAEPLQTLAGRAFLSNKLQAVDAQPDTGAYPKGHAMPVCSLKMRTTLWGTPDRITVSLMKTNVWDRRVNPAKVPTLQEIKAGAFAPANQAWVNPKEAITARPASLGYLRPEGGTYDPFREPLKYAFPCPKPVGQIILGLDDFAGAEPPELRQSCASGVVTTDLSRGPARAHLEWVLGMTSNLYAVRGVVSGGKSPVSLRLYRHQDTSHLAYMAPDGKAYTLPGTEAGRAWNGPIDPPASGRKGRYFWIRQKLPAEKTFPDGFEYLLMGTVIGPAESRIESVQGQTGLGTPPPNAKIAAASGAAATATFQPGSDGKFEALVTVVTTMDGSDLFAEARRRLDHAASGGFEAVVAENKAWWRDFYTQREEGRVFGGQDAPWPGESVEQIYRSWYCTHGGGTRPDMRQLEASAHYAAPEVDSQPWNGMPCYNEIFYTSSYVHHWSDRVEMWRQTVNHWLPGGRQNARDMYGLPGICLTHGYQPPTKPDRYVHSAIALELCLGTMAQLVRPIWDEWDYQGDREFLRSECYPVMREVARFYAAYAQKGDDGRYHITPCMLEECWGIYPEFKRNQDAISSLCMFRWALLHAAEAAEILGVDADQRTQWRKIARGLAPNPTWKTADGEVLGGLPGIDPKRYSDDHPWDPALYPVVLADEINLDSPADLRAMAARTASSRPNTSTTEALILVGAKQITNGPKEKSHDPGGTVEALLNSRSGRIHLFPAVAPEAQVAFHRLQARGGFLVSACHDATGVTYVEIEARRPGTCRVMNPWPGQKIRIKDAVSGKPTPLTLDTSNGECLVFETATARRYRLVRDSKTRDYSFLIYPLTNP